MQVKYSQGRRRWLLPELLLFDIERENIMTTYNLNI